MKFRLSAALLAAMTLAGCAGPQGNPDRQPYANERGGAIAVPPQTIGAVSYDPYAAPAPFSDMQPGQAAINPPPPLPVNPSPTPMTPARRPY